MKKNEIILSSHFFEMLDCITKQLATKGSAMCLGEDLGTDFNSKAKDYFSFAIRSAELPQDMVMFNLLSDVSSHMGGKKEYVFTLFINLSQIEGPLYNSFLSIILSHGMCHFVFYYELFLRLCENTNNSIHEKFIKTINNLALKGRGMLFLRGIGLGFNTLLKRPKGRGIKPSPRINKNMSKSLIAGFDNYSIHELIENVEKFTSKKHFTGGIHSEIDYKNFFYDFLTHLDSMLRKN